MFTMSRSTYTVCRQEVALDRHSSAFIKSLGELDDVPGPQNIKILTHIIELITNCLLARGRCWSHLMYLPASGC